MVSVNPFKAVPSCGEDALTAVVRRASEPKTETDGAAGEGGEAAEPDAFGVAARCWERLVATGGDQAVLVQGESGAVR